MVGFRVSAMWFSRPVIQDLLLDLLRMDMGPFSMQRLELLRPVMATSNMDPGETPTLPRLMCKDVGTKVNCHAKIGT